MTTATAAVSATPKSASTKNGTTRSAKHPSKAKVTKPAKPAPKTKKAKTKKATTTAAQPRERIDADAIITKVAKENPRREGGEGYKNWARYTSGISVQKYLDSSPHAHLGHVRYDRDHGFIKLVSK